MLINFARKICFSDSHYRDISNELKAHYDSRWHHARATLIRVYFSNPQRGTGSVAAVVLAVIQTIHSIQSSVMWFFIICINYDVCFFNYQIIIIIIIKNKVI